MERGRVGEALRSGDQLADRVFRRGRIRDNLARFGYPLYREMEEAWRDTGDAITGSREFLVQDPDGYLLRFSEYLGERELKTEGVYPEERADV